MANVKQARNHTTQNNVAVSPDCHSDQYREWPQVELKMVKLVENRIRIQHLACGASA